MCLNTGRYVEKLQDNYQKIQNSEWNSTFFLPLGYYKKNLAFVNQCRISGNSIHM